jgi:hypothetical protein
MAIMQQPEAPKRSRAVLLFWFHPSLFAYNVAGTALLFLLWTIGSGPLHSLNPVVAAITALLLVGVLELIIRYAGRRTERPSGILGYIAGAYVLFHAFRTAAMLLLVGLLELVLLMGALFDASYHPVIHPPTVVMAAVYGVWATLHLTRRRRQRTSRLPPAPLRASVFNPTEPVSSPETR